MKHRKKTVNVKAQLYQQRRDLTAQAAVSEGIRQGLEDVKNGRTRPARQALEEFRRVHKIPR